MTRDNFLFNAYIQVAHANAIYNSQCKYDSRDDLNYNTKGVDIKELI